MPAAEKLEMLADFTREIPGDWEDVHVCTLDVLFAGLGSTSLAVTVAVFVKHVPAVGGAEETVAVGDGVIAVVLARQGAGRLGIEGLHPIVAGVLHRCVDAHPHDMADGVLGIEALVNADKPVAAVCHAPAAFVNVRGKDGEIGRASCRERV